jgi:ATP-binding cassette subfamily B protein
MWLEPLLTAATFLGLGGLYLLIARGVRNRVAADSEHVTAGQSRVTQVVQEGLGGIRDVLIEGLQETYFRIYRQADTELRRALANISILAGAPRPVIEALGVALIGWLAYVLASRPEGMATAIPMLGALALAAQRLLPLVQQGYAGWASMLGGQESLRDVLALLEQPLPEQIFDEPPAPIPFKSEIGLHDVRFRYGPEAPWVLHGIDLQIQRGSRIGLIGETGSGKSTLLDIVMGLLDPTSGEICIDGLPLSKSNYRGWQAHIAHVPQAIFLADAPISENIAFGVPSAQIDHARVEWAAERAQLARTISAWNDGYATFVGEQGVLLSGGQRQRIGIARALYKQADVIVLDEATSALDNATERSVMEAIDSLDSEFTMLIVAHRLTTLKSCDQIIELSDGVVQRVGTYADMFARSSQNAMNH